MDSLQGRIEERPLPEVLLLLARKGGRGILTVQGDQEIIGLSLFDGQLVSADALNQSLEEGLGRILTAGGLVSNDVLANLSAEHHAGGGRVVDLLLERNYISRETLTAALREHACGLCVQVLGWTRGEYKFYRGDEVAFEQGVDPIPIEEALVRAADELESPDLLGGMPPSPDEVFEQVDSLDASLASETLGELLSPGLTSAEPGEEIHSLLDRVDGSRTVSLLARDAGMSAHRARLTLLRMEQADLLRRRAGGAAAPSRQAFASASQPAEPELAKPEAPPPLDLPRVEPAVPPSPVTVPLPVMEPEPAPEPEPEPEASPPQLKPRRPSTPPAWLARALAAVMLVAVAIYCLLGRQMFLPFPWHDDLGQAFAVERQTGIFLQVERAARTFFLLEGRFPEGLDELEQAGLLAGGQVRDAGGGVMSYSATATSFSLQATGGTSRTVGIGGNFLLDPEFQDRAAREEPPLVLLD